MWTRWLLTLLLADGGGVSAGDRWTYDVKDEVTGEPLHTMTIAVISLPEGEIVTRSSIQGEAGFRQIVFDRSWNRIDDGDWSYSPSDGTGIQGPLHVGKQWRFANTARHFRTGILMNTQGHSEVVEREKFMTKAGTIYDTFKIECQMRRVSSNYQTATTVSANIWYAGAVNRWVKRTWRMQMEGRVRDSLSEELTNYSRKP